MKYAGRMKRHAELLRQTLKLDKRTQTLKLNRAGQSLELNKPSSSQFSR